MAVTLRGTLSPFEPSGYKWLWDLSCKNGGSIYVDVQTGAKLN